MKYIVVKLRNMLYLKSSHVSASLRFTRIIFVINIKNFLTLTYFIRKNILSLSLSINYFEIFFNVGYEIISYRDNVLRSRKIEQKIYMNIMKNRDKNII